MVQKKPRHPIHALTSESMAVLEDSSDRDVQRSGASRLESTPVSVPGFGELPLGKLPANWWIVGSPQSGKTQLILWFIRMGLLFSESHGGLRYRMVVADDKREFLGRLLEFGVPLDSICIVNFADKRSSALDLQREFGRDGRAGYETLSHWCVSFSKSNSDGESGSFFLGAARALFAVLIRRLAERGELTLWNICRYGKSRRDLESLLPDTDFESRLVRHNFLPEDEPRLRSGVFATVAEACSNFEALAEAQDRCETTVCLEDWARGSGVLLVGGSSKLREISEKWVSLIFERVGRHLLEREALPEIAPDRTIVVLDELRSLGGALPILPRLASKGRGLGVTVVAGTQNMTGLTKHWTADGAEELLGLASGKVILRIDSAKDRKALAEIFGERESLVSKPSFSAGVSAAREFSHSLSSSLSLDLVTRPNVLPSHLNLPPASKRYGIRGFTSIFHLWKPWHISPQLVSELSFGPFVSTERNFIPWDSEGEGEETNGASSERGGNRWVIPK